MNAGDTAWVLVSAGLVMIMMPASTRAIILRVSRISLANPKPRGLVNLTM
jgi:hypothetical protein